MIAADYVANIKTMLGHPRVTVEATDEQIEACVLRAFKECSPYITDTKTETISVTGQRINLTAYSVDYVTAVYKVPGTYDYDDPFSFPGIAVNNYDYNRLLETGLHQRLINTVRTDLSYRFDSPYLYIDVGFPASEQVTIEYVPKKSTVSDVQGDFWEDKLFRLALAYSKEIVGRIRSKYKPQNYPFELDGDTLLSEAATEIVDIRQSLTDNADSFFPE